MGKLEHIIYSAPFASINIVVVGVRPLTERSVINQVNVRTIIHYSQEDDFCLGSDGERATHPLCNYGPFEHLPYMGLPIYSNCPDPLLAEMFETQQLIFFEFLAHAIFTVYWPIHYIHSF